MAKTLDKSPQERHAEKLRQELEELTGIKTGNVPMHGNGLAASPDVAQRMGQLLHDAIITGARTINPDDEDSSIHCSAEWHFARYKGKGRTLASALYHISWYVTKVDGNFFLSKKNLARYLDLKDEDEIGAAAHLLEADGFWEVIEREKGNTVKYRPIGHKDWARTHPNRCTHKIEINYVHDNPELAALGRNLYAVLGGEKFHENILLGVRNAAPDLNDEEIINHGKLFLNLDKNKGSGKDRRKRFLEYLRNLG